MNKERHIDIMGIVNLTDDSFFAGSRCADTAGALERIRKMADDGATIIDIGACSTRPGSFPVGAEEEWRRIEPVLKAVKAAGLELRLSIDTEWADVVSRTYDLIGDFIVNDVSAGSTDSEMLLTVGNLRLAYVAMHRRGTPDVMQTLTDYDDVTAEVLSFFECFAENAEKSGVNDWIIDPGFGFSKTIAQNYEMLARLDEFTSFGRPLLVGVSRKSMIYKKLNISPEESLPATQVLHFKALQLGADILRVHDVVEAVRTVALYKSIEWGCL